MFKENITRLLENISIKRKFTAIIMFASTVAVLLVSSGFMIYEVITVRQAMGNDLSTLSKFIGDRSTAALAFGSQADAEEELHALIYRKHINAAALYDKNGNLFVVYPPQAINKIPAHPESNIRTPDVQRFEPGRLIVFHQVMIDADRSVAGTVFLSSDLQELHQRFVRYGGIIVIFIGASWLVTLFLSSMLQRVITSPIFDLAETARAVAAEKNYSMRVAKRGRDELGQLINGFNDMLGQIQDRDARLQQAHDELEARVQERTRKLSDEIVERQRAEDALQHQFFRISLLNQITQAISDRQDTASILHVVLHELELHFGVDIGIVALADAKPGAFNIAAVSVKNPLLAKKLSLSEGSVLPLEEEDFTLYEKGQAIYVPDTLQWKAAFGQKLAMTGWRSAAIVPLMVEDKLFGILVTARLEPENFSNGDAEFLSMLSEHVALAVHQARLYANLEKAFNELRQTQAAVLQQERLKALGQMASGIAHDVNNALSPVIGFTDLLLSGNFGFKQDSKKYLGLIRTAGEDIAHIVARLREFYRNREMDESLQHLNLNPLVEQVVDMTRPRWRDIPQSNGITIEVETIYAQDMPRVAGLESEIREAITNLVLNAVDAMPKGGKITVRTGVIHKNAEGNSGKDPVKITVDITDTGAGMNEETRKRCLDPFFSTKGKRGTGLGLAMVYGVMERHKGGIEIQSVLGKGTTFRLVFPVCERLPVLEPAKEVDTKIEPMQILCIDDESSLRELLKEILERDGHKVVLSDSGQSGLDEFRIATERHRPFDLVITDLGMPYLDGRQVAKTIKLESPTTPVIMLTGWGAFIKEEDGDQEEADVILSKPPRSRELRETLQKFRHPRSGELPSRD
jgi:signal transduction histidine kinase/ActR/RegA family two-component response regulator/HAMP domain-containing protein